MNKKVAGIFTEAILAKAPHRRNLAINSIGLNRSPASNKALDDAYLDKFLDEIFDEEIATPQIFQKTNNPFIFSTPINVSNIRTSNSKVQVKEVEANSMQDLIEGRLIDVTKKLLFLRNSIAVYYEAEQVITSLSAEQALEHKEYLIKIYTWTLNRKNTATLSTQIELEDLKNVVVKKLCEAYMKTPQNQELQNELSRIEDISIARQLALKGEIEKAVIVYEKVYKNENNHEAVRRQALQFLCNQSLKRGDIDYLVSIKNSMTGQRDQNNMMFIEKVLSEMFESEENNNYMEIYPQNNQ